MNTCRQNYSNQRQEGLALAVSLVLLVALTLIGITTLQGTRLNEKIASNSQQKAISFEAAESSIASTWNVDALLGSLKLIPENQIDNPDSVLLDDLSRQLSESLDQTNNFGKNVDINSVISVQYCGEQQVPRSTSLNADDSVISLAGTLFDVNGVATIDGSGAHSDHVQRGYVVRPKTGRKGSC